MNYGCWGCGNGPDQCECDDFDCMACSNTGHLENSACRDPAHDLQDITDQSNCNGCCVYSYCHPPLREHCPPRGYTSSEQAIGPRRSFTSEIGSWDGVTYWREGRQNGLVWCIDIAPLLGDFDGPTLWVVCREVRPEGVLIGTRFGVSTNTAKAQRDAEHIVSLK